MNIILKLANSLKINKKLEIGFSQIRIKNNRKKGNKKSKLNNEILILFLFSFLKT